MMKNKIKQFILSIFVVLALTCTIPVQVNADTAQQPAQTDSVQAPIQFQTKQPIGKKQIALKFILAMVGVATSSIIIYVLLSLYNKYFYGNSKTSASNEVDEEFKTPTNLKDAVNIFLKKTK